MVHDDGKGLPPGFSIAETRSLGLSIVRDLVSTQMGGTISMRTDHGTVVELVIPVAHEADDLAAEQPAAAALGGHVALKADVPGLVHKSDAGAVELDLRGAAEVRRAMRRLEKRFAGRLSGVLVQPMISGGTEVIIGVVQEPVFGPLVVFGLGGVATEVLGDHAARLAPLTDTDADDLIHSIRAAPLLLGHRGQPAADIGALRDALLRISRLADDLPQVTELDLNPVIARPDGVFAVDARIRVTSHGAADPFLRQLRVPPPAASPDPTPNGGSSRR